MFASEGDSLQETERNNGSDNIKRRVLRQLQKTLREQGKHFVTDGSAHAYAPQLLFEDANASTIPQTTSVGGHYGPAGNGANEMEQDDAPIPSCIYEVKVKHGADDDDPDVKNAWY
jgi:hypothetical protein